MNPTFRVFWFARVLSLLGDGAAMLTLLLWVNAEGNSTDIALLLLATTIPRFLGPVAGTLADRVEVRRLLIIMELVQAGVFGVVIVARPSLPLLFALVAVATSASTIFAGASRIVVPRLVERTELMSANAWNGTALNLQAVGGPLLGGFLVPVIGTYGALSLNVATFAVSALMLLRLPPLPTVRSASSRPRFSSDVAEGLRYARKNSVVAAVAVLLFTGVLFGSLDNLALVLFVQNTLGAGATGLGVLNAAFGVAMVFAALWLTRSTRRPSPVFLMVGGWILTGLGLAFTGMSPLIGLAVMAQFGGGLGNGVAMIGQETLIQQNVPMDKLGRVGGILSSASFLGTSLAYVFGAWLTTSLAARDVLLVAGFGLAAVVVLCAPKVRQVVRRAEWQADTVEFAMPADTVEFAIPADTIEFAMPNAPHAWKNVALSRESRED